MTDDLTERGGRGTRGPWLWRATLNILALALGLALCETTLRIAAAVSPRIEFRLQPTEHRLNIWGMDRIVTREMVSDPVLAFRFSPYDARFDNWGYRNLAVPDSCSVLAIGDSMTFGFDLPADKTWPRILARLGNFCVYNASAPGYGPAEYDVILGETLALKPRLVVIGFYLGNDLYDAYSSAYVRSGDTFLRLRNPDPEVVARLAQLERVDSLQMRISRLLGIPVQVPPPQEDRGVKHWLGQHSRIYALTRETWHGVRDFWQSVRGEPMPVQWEKNVDTFEAAAAKPRRIPWNADPRFRSVFVAPEIVSINMDLDDPRVAEGQRIAHALLLGMHNRLKREGAELLVLLIPTKESVYAGVFDLQRGGLPPSIQDLVALESRARKGAIAFLSAAGIPHVDALPSLQAAFAGRVALYNESDDMHPTAAGQEAIARALLPQVGNWLRGPAPDTAPSTPSAGDARGAAVKAR